MLPACHLKEHDYNNCSTQRLQGPELNHSAEGVGRRVHSDFSAHEQRLMGPLRVGCCNTLGSYISQLWYRWSTEVQLHLTVIKTDTRRKKQRFAWGVLGIDVLLWTCVMVCYLNFAVWISCMGAFTQWYVVRWRSVGPGIKGNCENKCTFFCSSEGEPATGMSSKVGFNNLTRREQAEEFSQHSGSSVRIWAFLASGRFGLRLLNTRSLCSRL